MAKKWNKIVLSLMLATIVVLTACNPEEKEEATLKSALQDDFLMGVAVNPYQTSGKDSVADMLIRKHFNSIVAENCMKSALIQPEQGKFNFENADQFIEYGEKNNMFIVGHNLIWHSQSPRWFYLDEEGNDVSRDELINRMKTHISTLVGRYKGRVDGWDVVNEAINDDGSWRENKFYEIIGEDYVRLAFEFAREADPEAELYYNDYNMVKEGKREGVVKMIRKLQKKGIKVDGIGIQGHYYMGYPTIEELEKSIVAFAGLGCGVMITELDISALPNPWESTAEVSFDADYDDKLNPYKDGLPEDVAKEFNQRYLDVFNLFIKHSDKMSRVTMWGLSDAYSWKNNWPIRGRTDYPLLFDRDYQPKPVVEMIIEAANNK
jgi:endo-1,4-beta-xylanase